MYCVKVVALFLRHPERVKGGVKGQRSSKELGTSMARQQAARCSKLYLIKSKYIKIKKLKGKRFKEVAKQCKLTRPIIKSKILSLIAFPDAFSGRTTAIIFRAGSSVHF